MAALATLALSACVVQPGGPGRDAATLSLDEALARVSHRQAVLVDVRPADAYARGHVPGAANVPFDEILARAAELRRMPQPILYCG